MFGGITTWCYGTGNSTFHLRQAGGRKDELGAKVLADHRAVLFCEDVWLSKLSDGISSFDDYLKWSRRCRAVMGPLIADILRAGTSVVWTSQATGLTSVHGCCACLKKSGLVTYFTSWMLTRRSAYVVCYYAISQNRTASISPAQPKWSSEPFASTFKFRTLKKAWLSRPTRAELACLFAQLPENGVIENNEIEVADKLTFEELRIVFWAQGCGAVAAASTIYSMITRGRSCRAI